MDGGEAEYLRGGIRPGSTTSSLQVSSSQYLNNWRLKEAFAVDSLRRNGRDVPMAYLVPELLQGLHEAEDEAELQRLFDEERARNPELAAWLDARFVSNIRIEDVAACAPGTLGAKVHAFMAQSGLKLDFMYLEPPKTDNEYFRKRRLQNHDIEHMVTGLGPDPAGELALLYFNFEQSFLTFSAEFASATNRGKVMVNTPFLTRVLLHYPKANQIIIEAMALGVEMARKLKKPLTYVAWEEHFDRPLDEIRAEFGIEGFPEEGAWDWTYDAVQD
jgi:ubiquinone biosynthesis protein COQ4